MEDKQNTIVDSLPTEEEARRVELLRYAETRFSIEVEGEAEGDADIYVETSVDDETVVSSTATVRVTIDEASLTGTFTIEGLVEQLNDHTVINELLGYLYLEDASYMEELHFKVVRSDYKMGLPKEEEPASEYEKLDAKRLVDDKTPANLLANMQALLVQPGIGCGLSKQDADRLVSLAVLYKAHVSIIDGGE